MPKREHNDDSTEADYFCEHGVPDITPSAPEEPQRKKSKKPVSTICANGESSSNLAEDKLSTGLDDKPDAFKVLSAEQKKDTRNAKEKINDRESEKEKWVYVRGEDFVLHAMKKSSWEKLVINCEQCNILKLLQGDIHGSSLTKEPYIGYAIANVDFQGRKELDLEFKKGDTLKVLHSCSEFRSYGRHDSTDKEGSFLKQYVGMIPNTVDDFSYNAAQSVLEDSQDLDEQRSQAFGSARNQPTDSSQDEESESK